MQLLAARAAAVAESFGAVARALAVGAAILAVLVRRAQAAGVSTLLPVIIGHLKTPSLGVRLGRAAFYQFARPRDTNFSDARPKPL